MLYFSVSLKVTLSEIQRSQELLNTYRERKEKERLEDEAQSNVIIRKIFVKSLNNDLEVEEQTNSKEKKLEKTNNNDEVKLTADKILNIEDLDVSEQIPDEKAA